MALFPNPLSWLPNTEYRANVDEVTTSGSVIYIATSTGTSGTSIIFTNTIGSTATDNAGQTWLAVQNAREAWQASHAYTSGNLNTSSTLQWPDQVVEEGGLGLWQVVVSGTSGSSQPSWPSSPNWPPNEPPNYYAQPTITDGTVTWALVAYNDE